MTTPVLVHTPANYLNVSHLGVSCRNLFPIATKIQMVGPVRFELTTSCTPCKRATRLRYGPKQEKGHKAGCRRWWQVVFLPVTCGPGLAFHAALSREILQLGLIPQGF